MTRVYLDWNATTPLRPEARPAMMAAMDIVGNPSSVHAEGRRAKALVERARAQVAAAFGADGADIVFTSGATEGAALACAGRDLACAEVEHEAVLAWCDALLPVDAEGRVFVDTPAQAALQLANSETGVMQDIPAGLALCDATQAFGKVPVVLRRGLDVAAQMRGGGQEMGRRAGTENIIGIAGFGAAAEAAARDLADGVWDRVAELRNILDQALSAHGFETISVGNAGRRLPNTLCLIAPGWRGETQVMAMDLAGFAVSAGSACSSGKVRASRVLRAMGFEDALAGQAIRVSLGPAVTMEQVLRFADVWAAQYRKIRGRAA
jgi:cysteine desulfurase